MSHILYELVMVSVTDPLWWSINSTASMNADLPEFNILHSEKRVPKRCPWGTISKNGTLFSKGHSLFLNNHACGKRVPLVHWGTEIVPLRAPYYGLSNCAPINRCTVLVPFFLRVLVWFYSEKVLISAYPNVMLLHHHSLFQNFICI